MDFQVGFQNKFPDGQVDSRNGFPNRFQNVFLNEFLNRFPNRAWFAECLNRRWLIKLGHLSKDILCIVVESGKNVAQ